MDEREPLNREEYPAPAEETEPNNAEGRPARRRSKKLSRILAGVLTLLLVVLAVVVDVALGAAARLLVLLLPALAFRVLARDLLPFTACSC